MLQHCISAKKGKLGSPTHPAVPYPPVSKSESVSKLILKSRFGVQLFTVVILKQNVHEPVPVILGSPKLLVKFPSGPPGPTGSTSTYQPRPAGPFA